MPPAIQAMPMMKPIGPWNRRPSADLKMKIPSMVRITPPRILRRVLIGNSTLE
jgi:hypothetical protein